MYFFDKKVRELLAEAEAAATVEEVAAVGEKFRIVVDGMFTAGL